jgi:hypothetical protein
MVPRRLNWPVAGGSAHDRLALVTQTTGRRKHHSLNKRQAISSSPVDLLAVFGEQPPSSQRWPAPTRPALLSSPVPALQQSPGWSAQLRSAPVAQLSLSQSGSSSVAAHLLPAATVAPTHDQASTSVAALPMSRRCGSPAVQLARSRRHPAASALGLARTVSKTASSQKIPAARRHCMIPPE